MGKVTTPAGLTYVKDFSFPAAQGFSGSAGSHQVKGYQRGGKVNKAPVKKATGGTATRDGRDLHSLLYDEGDGLGFKRGGQVKAMGSPMVTSKQDTMDTGTQPARRGRNQAEIEAGGTKRMLPGYSKGGKAKGKKLAVHSIAGVVGSGGGALANAAIAKAKKVLRGKKRVMKAPKKASTAASKKGMPENVKMAGGMVHKARGGSVKK